MAIQKFVIRQGDQLPALTATLYDAVGVIDLSTASNVHFHLKRDGSTALDGVGVIVNALGGQVRYDWAAGDTAVAGHYEGEFLVNWASGKPQRVPNNEDDKLLAEI